MVYRVASLPNCNTLCGMRPTLVRLVATFVLGLLADDMRAGRLFECFKADFSSSFCYKIAVQHILQLLMAGIQARLAQTVHATHADQSAYTSVHSIAFA